MKSPLTAWVACLLLLSGCASPNRPQEGAGATPVGAPRAPAAAIGSLTPAPADGSPAVRLPDRIMLPASYRLMLLDGHLALLRETDPESVEPAPSSLRIVAGEIARGELGYQPGLLTQELAAEVAANRESAARMDNALESVMRRSRELSEQARDVQAESARLASLLAAAEARVRELESSRPAQARAVPPAPVAGDVEN